jgi:hypothetical protein
VGAPPAIANAVVDALVHDRRAHAGIPIAPEKVWRLLKQKRLGGVARKTSENRQTFCRMIPSS